MSSGLFKNIYIYIYIYIYKTGFGIRYTIKTNQPFNIYISVCPYLSYKKCTKEFFLSIYKIQMCRYMDVLMRVKSAHICV